MKTIATLLMAMLYGLPLSAWQNTPPSPAASPLAIGERLELHSKVLREKRVLNVYLPYGYSPDSLKRYPVIYLLDGSLNEDFLHIAGLVQFGSFSWINMLPETIVVGIANVDRKKDFTFPTALAEHRQQFPTSGQSAPFIDFIALEVQPLIENRYRTDTVKTIIGQSLGGLLATEILFKYPGMFNNYIIISPSLWWDNESLLAYTPRPGGRVKSVYIAVGREGEIMEREAQELHKKLDVMGNERPRLIFKFFPEQNHGDILHLAAYDAFARIFMHKKGPRQETE